MKLVYQKNIKERLMILSLKTLLSIIIGGAFGSSEKLSFL